MLTGARLVVVVACLGSALVGVTAKPKAKKTASPAPPPPPTGPFELAADAFKSGGSFPSDNRGDGDDVSPALSWKNAPVGTEAFVLIADESDASSAGPSTTNWLVYDIPSSVDQLRDELSGAGASDVPRLGMKEDAGQEPIVVDPMENVRHARRAARRSLPAAAVRPCRRPHALTRPTAPPSQAMMGMGLGGYEDPEMADMRRMISGAVDAGFDPSLRAKEGRLGSTGRTGYHVRRCRASPTAPARPASASSVRAPCTRPWRALRCALTTRCAPSPPCACAALLLPPPPPPPRGRRGGARLVSNSMHSTAGSGCLPVRVRRTCLPP